MNWQTLKDNIPFLSVLSVGLLILGLVNQMIYYYHFNIEIQYYTTVSEMFLSIADELFFILLASMGIIIEVRLHMNIIHSETENNLEENKVSRWKIYRHEIRLIIFCIIVSIGLLIFNANNGFIVALFFYMVLFIYPILVFEVSNFRKKRGHKGLNKNIFFFSYSICTVFILTIILAIFDFNKIEKGIYFGTKIFTKDSIYVSDKNHFYIGKTQNYYFIYNKDSSTLAIPEREVTKFDLKTNAKK